MGSGAFLGPCWGSGTVGRGSSVKLPLDHVHGHFEGVRRENDGDSEGVAIVEVGQEVGKARLGHVRGR
jgi:hypothetical protein